MAKATGLAARTVRDLRIELSGEGLIRALPEKDDQGAVLRWLISRTNAETAA